MDDLGLVSDLLKQEIIGRYSGTRKWSNECSKSSNSSSTSGFVYELSGGDMLKQPNVEAERKRLDRLMYIHM